MAVATTNFQATDSAVVRNLRPDAEDCTLVLKIIRVALRAERFIEGNVDVRVAEVLVGDETGSILWLARHDQQILAVPGRYLKFSHAHIRMIDGRMHLYVDRYGSVETVSPKTLFDVPSAPNVSFLLWGHN